MEGITVRSIIGTVYRMIVVLTVIPVLGAVYGCNTFDKKTGSAGQIKKDRPKAPLYRDFSDILIPGDFIVTKKYSKVVESDGDKTGFLSLYGPVELNSCVNFFNVKMPLDGWRSITLVKTPLSTLMVFNKKKRWCTIELSETEFTTDLRIGVSLEIEKPESASASETNVETTLNASPEPVIITEPSGVIEE